MIPRNAPRAPRADVPIFHTANDSLPRRLARALFPGNPSDSLHPRRMAISTSLAGVACVVVPFTRP